MECIAQYEAVKPF